MNLPSGGLQRIQVGFWLLVVWLLGLWLLTQPFAGVAPNVFA